MSNIGSLVSLFVPSLRGGGAERVMINLGQGLLQLGIHAELIVAQAEGPLLQHARSRIGVHNMNSSRVSTSLPGMVKYLRERKPIAVISALDHANITAAVARTLSNSSARLIFTVHNVLSMATLGQDSLRQRLVPYLARILYLKADHIVAVSQGVAEDLSRVTGIPRNRVEVIYNPVLPNDYRTLKRSKPQHPWFHDDPTPIILSAGRLSTQKDFATLIRAFATMVTLSNARLIILGDGSKRAELEALVRDLGIEERATLPGFVDNPLDYMAHANVFALSSAWEGFGIVLVEAMSCGTPVVATDCPGGVREVLENGRYGRIVPVGNPSALAEALLETMESSVPREELIRRAGDFSIGKATSRFIDLIRADDTVR